MLVVSCKRKKTSTSPDKNHRPMTDKNECCGAFDSESECCPLPKKEEANGS